jgi:hypothetical protein
LQSPSSSLTAAAAGIVSAIAIGQYGLVKDAQHLFHRTSIEPQTKKKLGG